MRMRVARMMADMRKHGNMRRVGNMKYKKIGGKYGKHGRNEKEWKPEKSWKHDGSCQPSCSHTGRQIRPKMVLVMKASQMVIGEKQGWTII